MTSLTINGKVYLRQKEQGLKKKVHGTKYHARIDMVVIPAQ